MTIEERDEIIRLLRDERDDDWGDDEWNMALLKAEVIVEMVYEQGVTAKTDASQAA